MIFNYIDTSYVAIEGIQIKTPSKLGYEFYKITDGARTLDGTMNLDLIAQKRKFTFSYEVLDSTEFSKIAEILYRYQIFFSFAYNDQGVMKSATIYPGAFKFYRGPNNTMINVTFDLIER